MPPRLLTVRAILGVTLIGLAVSACAGQQGPAGVAGAPGAPGAQGPPGPAGIFRGELDGGATFAGRLNVGPVSLAGTSYDSAATITAGALGSGVNGPLTAQTGLTVNLAKDNWWTGGNVGEVDGLNVFVRQNGAGSDCGGILVNVQNQGRGFLAATEFASTIVDPTTNTLTQGIDIQEGVLNATTGDSIGAVYTADYGQLSTGILIQNSQPDAGWQYAIRSLTNGGVTFSVDGLGNVVGRSADLGGVGLNGDAPNGSVAVGNLANPAATPYLDLNGLGVSSNVRMINDANGQLTIDTSTGGNLQVNAAGVFTTGSYHLNLSTPASSTAYCTPGQLGADASYVYVCIAKNTWKRAALSSF